MLLARALCLLAPRAGLGHYGQNIISPCVTSPSDSCRGTFVELFLPIRSAESSLLVLPSGKQQAKKARAIRRGLIVYWLPKMLSQSMLLWLGMKMRMTRVAKGHTKLIPGPRLYPSEAWFGLPEYHGCKSACNC